MVMEPINAWIITRNGEPRHIRMTKGIAEACASIERDWLSDSDPNAEIKVVPVLVTEIEDVK